eukprot:scaffold2782_cov182-Amphora_coffeaeformis.AAC.37
MANEVNSLLLGIALALALTALRNHLFVDKEEATSLVDDAHGWLTRLLVPPFSQLVPLTSHTMIQSQYIQDEARLNELRDLTLWKECSQADSFWMDAHQRPQNVWEELALEIWASREISQKAVGYEYWCNELEPDYPLTWHIDKDEILFKNKDILSTPTLGAVYYGYPHVVQGGYLEILKPTGIDPIYVHPENAGGQVERIYPEYNRLVILNVSGWHRVSPISFGQRYALAVNLWHTRPTFAP